MVWEWWCFEGFEEKDQNKLTTRVFAEQLKEHGVSEKAEFGFAKQPYMKFTNPV